MNSKLAASIARWADETQEGFVKGRQGLNNVCTIDAHARAVDAKAVAENIQNVNAIPLLLLFDLAAAFPSIAHAYLFAVLEYFRMPRGCYIFFSRTV